MREHRSRAFGGAVFLDEIEARERNVELRAFGVLQHHELSSGFVLRDLLQAEVLADAVLHVHNVIADGEVAEVGEKVCGLRSFARRLRYEFGVVEEITSAEDNDLRFRQRETFGDE